MSELYVVLAILDWILAGLYAFDSRWGLAALWLVAGTLMLVAARFQARACRIRQEIARLTAK